MSISAFKETLLSLACVVCLVLGGAVFYSTLNKIFPGHEPAFFYRRFQAISRFAERLDPARPTAVVIGASDVALNFSPARAMEAAHGKGVDTDIFNFGSILSGPDHQRILAEKLRDALKSRGKMLDLAVFSFVPLTFTKNYRRTYRVVFPYFMHPVLGPHDMKAYLKGDRQMLASLYFLRLLGGGYGQGQLINILEDWLRKYSYPDGKVHHVGEVSNMSFTSYSRIFTFYSPRGDLPYWDADAHGEFDLYDPKGKNLADFIVAHRADLYHAGFHYHRLMYRHLQLNFDSHLFSEFDRAVDALRSVAKRVAVFYIPVFDAPEYPQVSAAGRHRLAEQIEMLRKDPRFIFWDYSGSWHPGKEDYFDPVHMTEAGRKKFNALFAEDVANLLRSVSGTENPPQ